MNKHTIVVYGWDDFGFALAHALDQLDAEKYDIKYYTNNERIKGQLMEHGSYAKGAVSTSLKNVAIADSDEGLFDDANTIYLDAPLNHIRQIAKALKASNINDTTIVGVDGGIEDATGQRISEVIAHELEGTHYHYVQLGGDQDAHALLRNEPLRVGIASVNDQNNRHIQEQLAASSLKPFITEDVTTAEIAQALGGVLALYSGMLAGLGYSIGTTTGLTTQLATELKQLAANNLGANPKNMNTENPFWANAQWMVCNTQNADHQLGLAIAEGLDIDQAVETLNANQRHITGLNTLMGLSSHEPFMQNEIVRTLIDICIERTAIPEDIRSIVSPYNGAS